jgi:hypothetical protein
MRLDKCPIGGHFSIFDIGMNTLQTGMTVFLEIETGRYSVSDNCMFDLVMKCLGRRKRLVWTVWYSF